MITVLVPPGVVTPGAGAGRRERLDDAEQHHLRVRRALEGERVALRDGAGLVGIGRIAIVGKAWEVEVENAERNGVTTVVDFLDGDAGDLAPLLGPADLLLSNILRLVNTALLPAIVATLRPGGLAIFSGMEELEAPLFRPVLETAGLVVLDEVGDNGWWAVAAARP